ncbi:MULTISPECIES: DUF3598 family protein [unclassified Leptolyngbya]|uniref:DUF3598 family protein n=1 Tax=unclassified Leptolyngbya TaxID=2650499 RepID=UPI001683841C|nr:MULTISPECIES: DUF3598 family protein [unclassified Leptolyngbya]MBD1910570.1 DUF3598 family protein [Leptolyngbya sp. FACHB-8]MBD2153941.1 DUF3598 family protein [Leptolyngbya sp. FACHB-16]
MADPRADVLSQWDRLLLHLGEWQGSFTSLSATGSVLNNKPSCVTLSAGEDQSAVQQTVTFLSTDGLPERSTVLEYRSLNRGILFFKTGAFSQGSLQFSPFAEFGAEFGFILGDRRLRAVLQFHPQTDGHALTQLTLIREFRASSSTQENPPLTVESLLGTWKGTAQKLSPDWFEDTPVQTQLILKKEDDRLYQHLTTQGFDLKSSARIEGNTLKFDDATGQTPRGYINQTLLLPDGASCTFPSTIPRNKPFLLEVGWLPSPNLRYRLIRSYDAQGSWQGLTLVVEKRALV